MSNPPATGPRYWRSLDEMADTPAFREWAEREFPQGASEWSDPVSRRYFTKIMSASFLLAGFGLTGCRRPEENIHPFGKMPEGYVHGVPQHFATAMPDRGGAQALIVKSLDGRPLKIEGNPRHPLGLGGTNHFAQASLLNLYDPDRAIRFLKKGAQERREAALDALSTLAAKAEANRGEGLAFLLGASNSLSRERLIASLRQKYPQARWFFHEPVDFTTPARTTGLIRGDGGAGLALHYRLDRAKVILSLDHDFLGTEPDSARMIRDFARGRRVEKATDEMSRLYVAESLMSLTGANADHRLRVAPGQLGAVAAQLAATVLRETSAAEATDLINTLAGMPLPAGVNAAWIKECAADLLAHKGEAVVLAGHRQPEFVHALAQAINRALGSEGKTVALLRQSESQGEGLEALAQALREKQVQTLVISGVNPVYTAPANLEWSAVQRLAPTVIRLAYDEDETTALCDWQLPATHYLESWGDARTADGTLVGVQPLISPLFEGMTELEFLARIGKLQHVNPHEIVRETLRSLVGPGDFEVVWKRFLRDGFLADSASAGVEAPLVWEKVGELAKAYRPGVAPTKDRLDVVFHRDYSTDDGRYNNNGWLQELPDPITKVCWENVVTVSARTAKELGVYFENPERGKLSVPTIKIELDGRSIEAPVWIQPGQADYTLGLALGYGRTKTGRVGKNSGYNAYLIRTSTALNTAAGARVTALSRKQAVSTTQDHWAMEGRAIVREANLEQFREHPAFAQNMDLEAHLPKDAALYQHPHAKDPTMKGIHQWGMAVDLNTCVGCAACVMACQSENNIPIVGKDQVARGREMHWIRLDRYFSVNPKDTELADPQVVNQPMFCQHCENAPCENVCPVNATVHDEEGLNVMVYNRCVGTRYCSNNCPYKVRRFNYFDYNQRPLDRLYEGPLAPKGMPDLVQMAKNPDVTVRMRGVMEKCTFCVQRIEQAKIAQKVKAGASGDVRVPDGTITPACAQACPAEAIVFGDVADPQSRVSRVKEQSRDYSVLGFLYTKPRVTYQARIRNPNPRMPDYHQQPLSLAEYARVQGDPMAEGHHPAAAAEAAVGHQKGGH
jgi:molybdopterin-containing oxidoreductase family iron-sulfur binding subunit